MRTRDELGPEDLDFFENDASVQSKSESDQMDSHNQSMLREIWNVVLGGDWHSKRTVVKWLLEVRPSPLCVFLSIRRFHVHLTGPPRLRLRPGRPIDDVT